MSDSRNANAFNWMGPLTTTPISFTPTNQENREDVPPRPPPRFPTRHPRQSIDGVFSNLSISTNLPRKLNLPQTLAGTLRLNKSWPNWSSLSKVTGSSFLDQAEVKFTIRTSQNYRQYAAKDDLEDLFTQVSTMIMDIHKNSTPNDAATIEEMMTESLIEAIFSSNYIERAGTSFEETMNLCRRIFHGEDVKAEDIEERSPEYQAAIESLRKRDGKMSKDHVIRSRLEVIQHAKAMDYITRAIAVDNQPLSEELIKATHRILIKGIDCIHGDWRNESSTPWRNYAGQYRSHTVAAGNTNFAVPRFIPKLMKRMVAEFNVDIAEAESKQHLDPFYLAAKYSNEFVQIHPFLDGNGRISRLILNAILVKYAGIVVSIG